MVVNDSITKNIEINDETKVLDFHMMGINFFYLSKYDSLMNKNIKSEFDLCWRPNGFLICDSIFKLDDAQFFRTHIYSYKMSHQKYKQTLDVDFFKKIMIKALGLDSNIIEWEGFEYINSKEININDYGRCEMIQFGFSTPSYQRQDKPFILYNSKNDEITVFDFSDIDLTQINFNCIIVRFDCRANSTYSILKYSKKFDCFVPIFYKEIKEKFD